MGDLSMQFNDDPVQHLNNKKLINESDVHLDSGYTSYNITGSTNSSGSSPFLTSNPPSVRKQFDLEPISENHEATFLAPSPQLNETPTTKSIRQISAFHITTPIHNVAHQETTPTKSNFWSADYTSPRPKVRTSAAKYGSPLRLTPNKRSARGLSITKHVSFSDKLQTENEEKENSYAGADVSIGFSPIANHNNSIAMSQESPRRILESSTPLHNIYKRPKVQTVAKCQFTENSPRSKLHAHFFFLLFFCKNTTYLS